MMNETELYLILIFSTVAIIIYPNRHKITEIPITLDLFRREAKKFILSLWSIMKEVYLYQI